MKTQFPSTAVFSSSEIQIHYKRPLFSAMRYISCAEDVNSILVDFVDLTRIDLKEFFWVLLLNHANRLLGVSEISIGNLSGVAVNVKEIFQLTLLTNASSVIVAHNHPSGNLKPSNRDREITKKIKSGLSVLDVSLLDHLIISSESFYSFVHEGLL